MSSWDLCLSLVTFKCEGSNKVHESCWVPCWFGFKLSDAPSRFPKNWSINKRKRRYATEGTAKASQEVNFAGVSSPVVSLWCFTRPTCGSEHLFRSKRPTVVDLDHFSCQWVTPPMKYYEIITCHNPIYSHLTSFKTRISEHNDAWYHRRHGAAPHRWRGKWFHLLPPGRNGDGETKKGPGEVRKTWWVISFY